MGVTAGPPRTGRHRARRHGNRPSTRFAEFTLEVTRDECVIEYRPHSPEPDF
jgi:hypothetical protein